MATLEELIEGLSVGEGLLPRPGSIFDRNRVVPPPRLRLPTPPSREETPPNLIPFSGDTVLQPGTVPGALTPQSREERHFLDENWKNFLPPPYHAGQAIGRFIQPRDEFGRVELGRGSATDLLMGLGLLGSSFGGVALSPRVIPRREIPQGRFEVSRTSRREPPIPPPAITDDIRFPDQMTPLRPFRRPPRDNLLPETSIPGVSTTTGRMNQPANESFPPPPPIPDSLKYEHAFLRQQMERAIGRVKRRNVEEHPFQVIEGGPGARRPFNADERALNTFNEERVRAGLEPLTQEQYNNLRFFFDSEVPPGGGEHFRTLSPRAAPGQSIIGETGPRTFTRGAGLFNRQPPGLERTAGRGPIKLSRADREAILPVVGELRSQGLNIRQIRNELQNRFPNIGQLSEVSIYNMLRKNPDYVRLPRTPVKTPRKDVPESNLQLVNRDGRWVLEPKKHHREFNPAEGVLFPGRTPFDRTARPGKPVNTVGSSALGGRQVEMLNQVEDWLRGSGIQFERRINPNGTMYLHAKHPHTNENIQIRVSRDGHIGFQNTNIQGTGKTATGSVRVGNLFDTGYRHDFVGKTVGGRERVIQPEFIGNISGDPYAQLPNLFDALSHRFSRNPSGQFLISEGRQPHYPSERLTPIPMTGYTQWGRRGIRTEPPTELLARNEIKRVSEPTQIELPFEGARRPTLTLRSPTSRKHHREFNPAEGVLFPGRTPFDRAAFEGSVPFRLQVGNRLRRELSNMPDEQRRMTEGVMSWLVQSNIPFRTKLAGRGSFYIYARDTLGKNNPLNEAGRGLEERSNIATIRVSRDGHVGVPERGGPAGFFETGKWMGQEAKYRNTLTPLERYRTNISGQSYSDLSTLTDALAFRFSKSPSGQFLVPPGRRYNPPETAPIAATRTDKEFNQPALFSTGGTYATPTRNIAAKLEKRQWQRPEHWVGGNPNQRVLFDMRQLPKQLAPIEIRRASSQPRGNVVEGISPDQLNLDLTRPVPIRNIVSINAKPPKNNPLSGVVPNDIIDNVHDIIMREVRRNRALVNINSIRATVRRAHDIILDRNIIERYLQALKNG